MSTPASLLQIPLRLLIAAAALAVASITPAGRAATHAASAHAPQPRPTIVLLHGAWADSSCWSQVVQQLHGDGYTVDVPPNPLLGLPSDPAYVADFLHTITGPIVLVGHSYGGAVITNAAVGNAQVKALVYVDAFIPDEGESLLQLASARPGSRLGGNPIKTFNFVPYPGAAKGDFELYIKPSVYRGAIANDLPARTAAVLAATQRPLPLSALMEPSGAPAWKTIPSWSLVGTRDHAIPAAEQMFMSRRAHAHIVRVNASHLSMISHPNAVTALIVAAANATS